jgi:predicted SnoaL-like aldol condensation-catalyzing enzyme
MPGTQEALARRWFEEVWNQERRETIDEMMSPTLILHDEGETAIGPEAFKKFYDELHAGFSNIRVKTHEVVSSGDMACVRWSSTLEHRGSGKKISVTGMTMFRFADSKFVESWQSWDKFGLTQQLGVQPLKNLYVKAAGSD